MITMTTMTTCLSLVVVVVVGEVPTIRLLELAQVLGLPSPHGTSKTIFTKIYVLDQSLCQLRTHRLFCISPCAYGLLIIRICTVCTVFGYFTHLCPLGEVVCCHLLSSASYFFRSTIACGSFSLPSLDLGPSTTMGVGGCETVITDQCLACRCHHAGHFVIVVRLELWSHRYILQNPVSSFMLGRS